MAESEANGHGGIGRRRLLAGAGAGLLLPAALRAAPLVPLAGFTHGVASGEPGPTSMLVWTRFEGRGDTPIPLRVEVSTDPRMARARIAGEALADPARDWTARTVLRGLAPGKVHYYRFIGPGKARSVIGRTRTLPEGTPPLFRMGVFSCSNLPFGWFNAYGHAVAADDIDLMLHLGDYIYEYRRGVYPAAAQAVPGRSIDPAGETVTRADYWARYRSYRADPDLQALHARVPVIAVFDDHEIANDAWTGGAENHDAGAEGAWADRVAAALGAWRDWLPVSDAAYARYDIGRLAALYRLDTRIAGRDRQLDLAGALRAASDVPAAPGAASDVPAAPGAASDVQAALRRFRDEAWVAGDRQMLGLAQERWLFDELAAAGRRGVRWQVLAQQVVMGELRMPAGAAQLAGPDASPRAAAFLAAGEQAARLGLPFNFDAWDGYPAARARLLSAAQQANADLVVLAGDTHTSWANDLVAGGAAAGVEFAGPSVTSPGIEASLRAPPATVAAALQAANPRLRWAEPSQRGYMHVTLTPAEARCEWRLTVPVTARAAELAGRVRWQVGAGERRLKAG